MLLAKLEGLEEIQKVLQTSKNGELTFKGVLAEENIKDSVFIVTSQFPVGVGHRDLTINSWRLILTWYRSVSEGFTKLLIMVDIFKT